MQSYFKDVKALRRYVPNWLKAGFCVKYPQLDNSHNYSGVELDNLLLLAQEWLKSLFPEATITQLCTGTLQIMDPSQSELIRFYIEFDVAHTYGIRIKSEHYRYTKPTTTTSRKKRRV